MNPQTIFVTGGTGMLGHNLIRLLLEQGHRVRALVRSPEKAQKLFADLRPEPGRFETVQGDMDHVAKFVQALQGVDTVIHTAAYFREYAGRDPNETATMQKINVDATLELMERAERAGVKTFVHTSSSGTIGVKPDGTAGDENTPPDAKQLRNAYFQSKVTGDAAIKRWLEQPRQIKVVSILPGWMFGPRDAGPTGAGGLVLQFLERKLPGKLDAGSSIADPRDVAQAMINAITLGRNGERYIVAGRYASLSDVFDLLERISGVTSPKRMIPQWLLENLARLDELRAQVTRTPVQLPLVGIQTLHLKRSMTSAKAERELGAKFRPLEETLRDTVNWYVQHGYVKTDVTLKPQRA